MMRKSEVNLLRYFIGNVIVFFAYLTFNYLNRVTSFKRGLGL